MSEMTRLDHMRVQLKEAQEKHRACMAAQVEAQRRTTNAEKTVLAIERAIMREELAQAEGRPVDSKEPGVSDHAVVRWLERKHGLNIDGVRAEILGDGTAAMIRFAGSGKVVKEGLALVFEDHTIVTVKPINKGAVTL